MMFLSLVLGLTMTSQAGPATSGSNELTSSVAAIREHLATSELSARQAKTKAAGDPEKRAALEKQYGDLTATLDNWRAAAAATTAKDWPSAQKRIGELSRSTARAIVEFGRDARRYISGGSASVDSRASSVIEQRLITAASALAQADDAARGKYAATLVLTPWSDIRE